MPHRSRHPHALLAALMLVIGASAAQAQLRPIRFGVGGGYVGVTGDAAEAAEGGWHALAAVDVDVPILPVGLRFDAAYNSLRGRDDGPGLRIANATANVTFSTLPIPIVHPYVVGGVGVYNAKADVDGAEASTRTGFNIGGGVRFDLLAIGAFVEARLHYVPEKDDFATTQFYPITFGLRF